MLAKISLPLGLNLRVMQTSDQLFAERVFSSTRDYLHQLPIPSSQVEFLIKQQFQLQQTSYAASFPAAETFIIDFYTEPAGKITLNQTAESLHIVDIAFVSAMRNKGFGRALLRTLKNYAAERGVPLRLSVDQQNIRAKKLYLELGFTQTESSATHDTLWWH